MNSLNVIHRRIFGKAEYHDIAPCRLVDVYNFFVDDGQAYPVGEFIDQKEIAYQ